MLVADDADDSSSWECVNIGFSATSLLLTAYEIFRYVAERLTPFGMLFVHVLKLTCSLAILALDIVVYTQHSEGHWSLAALATDAVLVALNIAGFVLALVGFRRVRSGYGDLEYHHPANIKAYGYDNRRSSATDETQYLGAAASPPGMARGGSASSRISLQSLRRQSPEGYEASRQPSLGRQAGDGKATSVSPAGRSRASSSAGAKRESTYNHQRDTAFDDYLAARQSVSLRDSVERAMGAEFGWVDPQHQQQPQQHSGRPGGGLSRQESSGSMAVSPIEPSEGLDRRDSLVLGGGMVARGPVGGDASAHAIGARTPSWEVLVSVPEEEDKEGRTGGNEAQKVGLLEADANAHAPEVVITTHDYPAAAWQGGNQAPGESRKRQWEE